MSATVSRRTVSVWALMSRPSLPRAGAGVQPSHDAVEELISALALGQEGQVHPAAAGVEDGHPVRVRPEARARFRDVVGDEQVDPLALELGGGPIERTRLCREPDEHRWRNDRWIGD